jgi:ABC-type lipoprotein release transport system permease subunit
MSGLWWRLAWRNLLRERRRSLITGSALALGFVASVLMIGLSDGIVAELIENGTGILSGQVQIHSTTWRPEHGLYATLGGDQGVDVDSLLARIGGSPGVLGASPRVWGAGLLSAGSRSAGAVMLGVDMERERSVGRLLGTLAAGRLPAPGARELLLGRSLAQRLGLRVGDTLVVVAPAADGSMGNDLMMVSGLFASGISELDATQAIVPIGTLQQLLALGGRRVHEVAIAVRDPWQAVPVADRVHTRLAGLGAALLVEPWTEFRPELAQYAELARASNIIIIGVVFLMAVFGVANTMWIGTWERRREFAVVRALGSSPSSVARSVLYEGFLLGAIALAGGVTLAWPLMAWWHHAPPDLSALYGGFTMVGALVRPVLRVEYSLAAALESAVALLITSLLAAVWPAWRAARIPPADALAGR